MSHWNYKNGFYKFKVSPRGMQQKIFSNVVLIIIGGLLAWLVLTNWQFHQSLKQTEHLVVTNEQKITAIEEWLNQNFASKQEGEKK